MKKNTIRLTESQLRNHIYEKVKKQLNELWGSDDDALDAECDNKSAERLRQLYKFAKENAGNFPIEYDEEGFVTGSTTINGDEIRWKRIPDLTGLEYKERNHGRRWIIEANNGATYHSKDHFEPVWWLTKFAEHDVPHPDDIMKILYGQDVDSKKTKHERSGVEYTRVSRFDDGFAVVQADVDPVKFNFVDKEGNILWDKPIEKWFDEVEPFSYGSARVKYKGFENVIGANGKLRREWGRAYRTFTDDNGKTYGKYVNPTPEESEDLNSLSLDEANLKKIVKEILAGN